MALFLLCLFTFVGGAIMTYYFYQRGFSNGFIDGYDAGKESVHRTIRNLATHPKADNL